MKLRTSRRTFLGTTAAGLAGAAVPASRAAAAPDAAERRRLIELAESYPEVSTQIHQIVGATRTLSEIYLIGSTGVIPTTPFEEFACVERVVRVTEKYRSIGRHEGGLDATVAAALRVTHIGGQSKQQSHQCQ